MSMKMNYPFICHFDFVYIEEGGDSVVINSGAG